MKRKWIIALAAALAFVACKNIDDGGEIQPPAPEQSADGAGQGGVQKPGEVGNQGGGNKGDEQTPGKEENPDEEENPGEEEVLPPFECLCEITYVSMPNDSISPKRVSEILGALAFDYTMTNLSTGDFHQGDYVFYEELPQEVKRVILFKEVTEAGGAERDGEYEFPEAQKEVSFEIWHGGKAQFERTVKNGNYDRAATRKKVTGLLKEIVGEAEYEAISADIAAGKLTLTAEKIKAVGDLFPALEKDAEGGKEAKDVENVAAFLQNKEAFVAQAEGEIEVRLGPIYPDWYEEHPFLFDEEAAEKKYVVTYEANVIFEDTFNLSEISLPDNNGKGNFTNATLTNDGEDIIINKLNTIRGSSLPTLKFNNVKANNDYYLSDSSDLYKLYKAYSEVLGKLENVKGNMDTFFVNGAIDEKDNFINGYTLFKADGNTAKDAGDETVKSLTIDVLILMYKNLGINKFLNMIIYDTPTNPAEVDWSLTNIVFEEDMSKVTNKGNGTLNGIVYFENKPYNNDGQEVKGMLKLDSLEGVSKDTLKIDLYYINGVLDVRGVDKKTIKDYNSSIFFNNEYIHAIYFSEDFIDIRNDQKEIN